MIFSSRLLSGLLLAGALHATCGAQTYNATKDLTPLATLNPNGVWTYGYLAPGTHGLVPYSNFFVDPTVIAWKDLSHLELQVPSAWKNLGDTNAFGVEPGQLSLHPGFTLTDRFDDASVIRFTAPADGTYRVKLKLMAGDTGKTEGWVVKNGRLDAPLAAFDDTATNPTWIRKVTLKRGHTLDVIVGHADDGYYSDNTPVSLLITRQ